MCTKCVDINSNVCFLESQRAGFRTPCIWQMLIIPPPLATALHRNSHMLLYKLFTYNGTLYWAATRPFRIQIKRLDFRLPRAKEGICVDTKALACHIIYCAWQGREVKDSFDLSLCHREKSLAGLQSKSMNCSATENIV